MTRMTPPLWMEWLLGAMLPGRSRETVTGDLAEEFRERKTASPESLRAEWWYGAQVVSFMPARVSGLLVQPRALGWLCGFTALCGAWLGGMDLLLRHPGYAEQMAIAGTIVAEALLTLAALRFRSWSVLRVCAMVGSVGLFWLGWKALMGVLRGGEMEGYILVIAACLMVQGVLTLGSLARMKCGRAASAQR